MRVVRVVLILAVALLMALPVLAQEKKKREGKRGGPGFDPLAMMLRDLNLSDEQKAKVEDVKKEFGPKLAEVRKKMDGVFTEENKKDRAEAEKAAKDAGKSPREVAAAARDAVKLTDEQKTKLAEVRKTMEEVNKDMREKVMSILTPEQKEQVEKRIAEMKKRGEGKKREKKAE
jgi:Spy/CpxP family protein refolding chaperone